MLDWGQLVFQERNFGVSFVVEDGLKLSLFQVEDVGAVRCRLGIGLFVADGGFRGGP